MADSFYVECDMQGNFLVSNEHMRLFIIFYSEEEKKNFTWKSSSVFFEPHYYYLSDKIYKMNGEESLISHDADYIKVLRQVCTNTYPGTITLAYEDLTKEIL